MKKIVVLMMCALLISGCSTKKGVVEYESEATQTAVAKQNQISDNERMQYKGTTKDGVSINVDVEIQTPEDKNMSVVEVEWVKYEEKEKEEIVKAFFGSEQVFVYDAVNYEKTQKEATDFSEHAFWGMKNNIEYVIDFVNREYEEDGKMVEHENNGYRFAIYPVDFGKVMPANIAKCESRWSDVQLSNDSTNNKCKYSKEEAKQMACDTLKTLGLDEYNLVSCENIGWSGGNTDNDTVEKTNQETNGYFLCFGRPINNEGNIYGDDLSYGFNTTGMNDFIEKTSFGKNEKIMYGGTGAPYLGVAIDDDGLVYLEACRLFNIKRIDSQAKILDLSIIEGIIEEQLESIDNEYIVNNTSYINVPSELSYSNKLKLHYYTQYQENSDTYFYLPVWDLEAEGNGAPEIFVNAIDGSIIQ